MFPFHREEMGLWEVQAELEGQVPNLALSASCPPLVHLSRCFMSLLRICFVITCSKKLSSWKPRQASVISALRRLMQEDHSVRASLVHTARPNLKQTNNNKLALVFNTVGNVGKVFQSRVNSTEDLEEGWGCFRAGKCCKPDMDGRG